ncbi:MAG: class II aldolase/adducin family protein [Phycisphaeraceae bacterium]
MNEAYLREQLCLTAHQLWLRGLIAGDTGLVSVEVHRRRFLITPPAQRRAALTADQVWCVDMGGQNIQGEGGLDDAAWRPHRLAYQTSLERALDAGDDRTASVAATILATPPALLAAVRTGAAAAFQLPSVAPDDDAALRQAMQTHEAVLLPGLGLLALGATLDAAHNRIEQLELAAMIELAAAGQASSTTTNR